MKSQLMSSLDVEKRENDQFKRHLERLLSFPSEQVPDLLALAKERLALHYVKDDKEAVKQACGRLDATVVQVESATDILGWFLNRMGREEYRGDRPEDIVADLVEELKLVPTQRRDDLLQTMKAANRLAEEERIRAHTREFERGGWPYFHGFAGVVNVRPVMSREGLPEDPTYQPEILGAIPVATVFFRVDEGSPETFSFQIGEEELTRLIANLQNLQKDLEAVKRKFRLADKGSS